MGTEEIKQGLETLVAWQKARDLMNFVHKRIIPVLPSDEKWDLASQIRRSSKSVMANIAEGYGRYYYQETVRFCYIARGSLIETHSHLVTSLDLAYIPRSLYEEGMTLVGATHRTLNGYIAYLKRKKRGGELPGGRLREISPVYGENLDDEDPFPNSQSQIPTPFMRGEQ